MGDSLKIMTWNIHGHKHQVGGQSMSKFEDKEFLSLITNYDIFGLTEIHASPDVDLNIPGYICHKSCRTKSKKATKYSGGVAVYIREKYRSYVELLPVENDGLVWIKLKACLMGTDYDLYICTAYIPPENSVYTSEVDLFEKLFSDICKFYSLNGRCVLMGDFNASTNISNDYVITNKADDLYLPLPIDDYVDTPLVRQNSDTRTIDTHGKSLINLCIASKMRIVNGRKLGDLTGKCTCYSANANHPTCIDYVIADFTVFPSVNYMLVHKTSWFSDHCMLTYGVKCKQPDLNLTYNSNMYRNKLEPLPHRPLWENTDPKMFKFALETICKNDIDALLAKDYNPENRLEIDAAINELNLIFDKVSRFMLKYKSVRKQKKKRALPKFVNKNCHEIFRNMKSLAQQLSEDPRNYALRQTYYASRRAFRKISKTCERSFKNNIINSLSTLQDVNPKEYWKLVKELETVVHPKTNPSEKIDSRQWFRHFTRLMSDDSNIKQSPIYNDVLKRINENITPSFSQLDFRISKIEIKNCINDLKNGKSPGKDGILNEMIKSCKDSLLPIFEKIFNLIFVSGFFPSLWKISLLTLIHKGGSVLDPNKYRGISLSSCISKLFCTVLKKRIRKHMKQHEYDNKYQIGFMENSRTSDHLLILRTLIDKYVKIAGKQKFLYVCFIDFQKAFDLVWHDGLFYKCLNYDINGFMYRILRDMYDKSSIQLKFCSGLSDKIYLKNGVKQGCVLSPVLFNLFINDLPTIFTEECHPASLYSEKLNCLLYADDLVLVSESEKGLQCCLDKLYTYCKEWNLKINVEKSKVIIFNKSGKKIIRKFLIGNEVLEISNKYTYLGIELTANGNFSGAVKQLCEKASKSLGRLKRTLFSERIDIRLYLDFFDKLIAPIFLYGCEVWGAYLLPPSKGISLDNINGYFRTDFDKLYIQFLKYILGVNSKACNIAVLSELGAFPYALKILKSVCKNWYRIANYSPNKLLYDAYKCNCELMEFDKSDWLRTVKVTLCEIGCEDIWLNDSDEFGDFPTNLIQNLLKEKFLVQWHNDFALQSHPDKKLRTYSKFKTRFQLEKYLIVLKDVNVRKNFTKLRISAHNLNIEVGRHKRPKKIPEQERICDTCKEIENEYHYVIECNKFNETRKKLFTNMSEIFTNFQMLNSENKFIMLMASDDPETSMEMAKFIQETVKIRGKL